MSNRLTDADWTHLIACKGPGMKRARMVGSKGRVTRLRVHAIRMGKARAEDMAVRLTKDNPGWTFQAKAARSIA